MKEDRKKDRGKKRELMVWVGMEDESLGARCVGTSRSSITCDCQAHAAREVRLAPLSSLSPLPEVTEFRNDSAGVPMAPMWEAVRSL